MRWVGRPLLRPALVAIAAAAAAVGLFATGCGRATGTGQGAASAATLRPTRGYILISLDTLRADHLGCYGYQRPTSPFLDSLAERATLFEEAYAQYPGTLVSHMSMFTGLYPREHGVLFSHAVLAPQIEVFPEVFQRQGFRTAAFTEGGYVSGRYGFRRGFDEFVARDRAGSRPLEATFRRGVRFLESLAPGERFLLFLHTYAIHAPYDAPPQYQELFWPGPQPAGALPPTAPALTRHSAVGDPLAPPVLDWLTARYDAGIRQTDDVLKGFFAELDRLGLGDVTVVLTADHGEELQDHGLLNHTQLYREVMHVPLIVVHPDQRAPVRHAGVVQLVDLAPTLYQLAQVEPQGTSSGHGLGPLVGHPGPPVPGSAWAVSPDGRALYQGERAALHSLLLFDRPDGDWISRRVAVEAPAPTATELQFEARSYRQPRRLIVRQGSARLAEVALGTEWTRIRLAPAVPGRLTLEADDCVVATAEGSHEDFQCLAFQVRGLPLAHLELYDVSNDPGQRREVPVQASSLARLMLRNLMGFSPQPRAAPAEPALEPELAEQSAGVGVFAVARAFGAVAGKAERI